MPEPLPPQPAGEESLDVWGFADSGFEVTATGQVGFRGGRYAISGKVIPGLLPWAETILGLPLDTRDRNASGYPTAPPARVANEPLERALASRLPAGRISTEPLLRLRHGHGHTQEDMWAVRLVLELAREHGACLVPFGGGTNVTDALRCPADERRTIVSLDLRRMNRVLWIDPVNHTAEIQAGATGIEIEEQLRRHGFTLGHEPDSIEQSTLGGWIATNASGMKKNRYGNIEEIVLSVRAVTPDGALARAAAPRESVGPEPSR